MPSDPSILLPPDEQEEPGGGHVIIPQDTAHLYKEPSSKAKLARLKQDILGDGVKEGKLEKFVELSEAINGGSGGGGDLPYLNDILNTENLTKIEVAKTGKPNTIFTLDESNGFSYTTEPLGRKITDRDIDNYVGAYIYFNGCRLDCHLGLSSDTGVHNMRSDDGVIVTNLTYGLPEGVILECMYKVDDSYSFDERNIDADSVSIEFWINPPSIELEPKTLLGTFNIVG